jgi:Na+:H+ antiporter, NhaA family
VTPTGAPGDPTDPAGSAQPATPIEPADLAAPAEPTARNMPLNRTDASELPEPSEPRPSWHRSSRFVPRTVVQPVLRFIELEVASGVVLLIVAAIALAWANSPWHGGYESFWNTPMVVRVGSIDLLDGVALRTFVNDALLSLFFVLAGLEIKRQIVVGELRVLRRALLPVAGALGGMIVPAVLYLAIAHGRTGSQGWGATVATDAAFAVGVVALAGSRVPESARIFILTLAVVDDIGGIIVIAVFYGAHVQGWWLVGAIIPVLVTVVLKQIDVRSHVPYVTLGVLSWMACRKAGVEAAIVGVVFGLLIPVRPFHDRAAFGDQARRLIDRVVANDTRANNTGVEPDASAAAVEELALFAAQSASPLERLEHRLGPWVILLVMPLLAFANAGIRAGSLPINGRIVTAVVVGRVLGKLVGISAVVWLISRLTRTPLPTGMTGRDLVGVAASGGIGFTIALFITGIAFTDASLAASAKLGVLIAAVIAGVLGSVVLRFRPSTPHPPPTGKVSS